jgi:hypothetical protein
VKSVDNDEPPASGTHAFDSPIDGVNQELGTQLLVLQGPVKGEPGEQDRRNHIGRAATDSFRQVVAAHIVWTQAEEGDDLVVFISPDECPSGTPQVLCLCGIEKPGVEPRFA